MPFETNVYKKYINVRGESEETQLNLGPSGNLIGYSYE